jgi:hypothetical protein
VFKSKPNICEILDIHDYENKKKSLKFDLKEISQIEFSKSGHLLAAVSG